ncbi:MAG: type I-F CRISPR-associated endoribonuclease Cas6/Csy4, partial [Methylococcales symbiont of Hymedesmia sp. n. MRB-2018]
NAFFAETKKYRLLLATFSGYCKISEILPVPDKVKEHQTISRIRQNMSITRLQKKVVHQKSKGYLKTDKDIMAYEKRYKEKMFKTGLDNPYLEIQSASNGHKYRRYIQFGELQDTPIIGDFDSFGLSKTTTIPWF